MSRITIKRGQHNFLQWLVDTHGEKLTVRNERMISNIISKGFYLSKHSEYLNDKRRIWKKRYEDAIK